MDTPTLYPDRDWRAQRALVASLSHHHPDSADLAEARRVLTYLRASDRLRDLMAAEPPLTRMERASLAGILLGGAA